MLRVGPSEDAAPTSAVTITFDRPVAGSLDRTVNPKAIFRVEPDLAGVVDWRDPVTLRFRPAAPFDGDVCRLPSGVKSRYATVALRVAGAREGASVRWTVDGVPHAAGRWSLRPGRHRFRATTTANDFAEVTVRVE